MLAALNPRALITHSAKAPGLHVAIKGFAPDRSGASLQWLTPNLAIGMLFVLSAITCATAVTLWSRAQLVA